jgi:hypothetical protein
MTAGQEAGATLIPIPRSHLINTIQSAGSIPSGAKALIELIGFMRGLKPPPPSVLSFSQSVNPLFLKLFTTRLKFTASTKIYR